MICPCFNTEHIGICSGTAAPHIPSIERMERYCFRDGFVSCAIFQQQLGLPGAVDPGLDLEAEILRGTVPVSAGAPRSQGRYAKVTSPRGHRRQRRVPLFPGQTGRKSAKLGMTLSAVLSKLL
jgi:hypothetical protein